SDRQGTAAMWEVSVAFPHWPICNSPEPACLAKLTRHGLRGPVRLAAVSIDAGCERPHFHACRISHLLQIANSTKPEKVTMRMPPDSQIINQTRRQLLSTAAIGVAAAGAASLFTSHLAAEGGALAQSSKQGESQMATKDEIRPFSFHAPEAELADLRRRIDATKWPEREQVTDDSQGVQLDTIQKLARYWPTEHDWRKVEACVNAPPTLITNIDGRDIHFIHVRSKHESALPMIVTHGWPGSIIEQLKILEPLTNPTAHGGSAGDAFHLIIPSLPGYGFSG